MAEKKILVTGGCGYIGSHVALGLLDLGYKVVVLDNLSSGSLIMLPADAEFIQGSVGDEALLDSIFKQHSIDAVMHFAASSSVSESVQNPVLYYENNVAHSLVLLKKAIQHGMGKFIFSSTSSVYGVPKDIPIPEGCSSVPLNPYGRTKRMIEHALADVAAAESDFRYVALRYFNVAGADEHARCGQFYKQSSHLIKNITRAAVQGHYEISIYGSNYPTTDGTCVRDYIHVCDLAQAHIDTLRYLDNGGQSDVFNVGYGYGYSVKEVISHAEAVLGKKFIIHDAQPRDGDPAILVAKSDKFKTIVGWAPKFNDLALMISSALKWEQKLNHAAHTTDL